MDKVLLIQVRFLDDRYHGDGDWPPSPARLFQALIAGNAIGKSLPPECTAALNWLESVPGPPEIFAPGVRAGRPYTTFVPNNDLDAKGGDPRRVADIRVGKSIRPRFVLPGIPIIYSWHFEHDAQSTEHVASLCAMADNLYQLGRGIDMAWASAVAVDGTAEKSRYESLPGTIYRPVPGDNGIALECPQAGSLNSLLLRYAAHRTRLTRGHEAGKTQVFFSQPPKSRFRRVVYNASNRWRLYDLRTSADRSPFRSWPQDRVVQLVEEVRDKVVDRLSKAMPDKREVIERVVIGRNATEADKASRVRLLPIPSIGHTMTNRSVRRLLVEMAPGCPLRFDDINWALSGLSIDSRVDEDTGQMFDTLLIPAEDPGMLRHYGLESGEPSRAWHTVTPAALPEQAGRRRIDPHHTREEAKGGAERALEEDRARRAVVQALRHAGIRTPVENIEVRREPFSGRGVRAEDFASGTRFAKERLWHIALTFSKPIEGPIVIGDGRYLGLGLMAPEQCSVGLHGLEITSSLASEVDPEDLAKALRRAVMARAQSQIGQRTVLPGFFTGHEMDGRTLRRGSHRHIAFAVDLERKRLLVIAPHILEARRPTAGEKDHLALLDLALQDFTELRAGSAGILALKQVPTPKDDDPIFGGSRYWETITPYVPTRYGKHLAPADALLGDAYNEIRRLGLPIPEAEVVSVSVGPRGGLSGQLRLCFRTAQAGPIVIGRSRHFGGGLFQKADK